MQISLYILTLQLLILELWYIYQVSFTFSMAFKVPLPVASGKVILRTRLPQSQLTKLELPDFQKSDFTDLKLIGQGSFGKVFHGQKNGSNFVIKELTEQNPSQEDERLFIKEAEMLKLVQGHENIVQIRGFSSIDFAILLDFVTFSFSTLGIEYEAVSSLKAFLVACDNMNSFKGFEHLQYYIASDICAGLAFLHSKNIVHRDFKTDNILVSNAHYAHLSAAEIACWWATKPVCAQLTDFGEARSTVLQTRTITSTTTARLFRGSPVYMAPEVFAEDGRGASFEELKKIDIWALGMVLFSLMNPDAKYPYAYDFEQLQNTDRRQALKTFHTLHQLPKHLCKYNLQQTTTWEPLNKMFGMCANYDPSMRPTAADVFCGLTKEYVRVQSLLVSQSTVSELIDEEIAFGRRVSSNLVQRTNNACTFLSLLIADRLEKSEHGYKSLTEITTDVIINFSAEVNSQRSDEKMYGVDEAFAILRKKNVCGDYEFILPTFSTGATTAAVAQQELRAAIHSLLIANEHTNSFSALYTCPPYTFLLCKTGDAPLMVVDTHMLSERYGGNNNAAIITALQDESSIATLCQWLFLRMDILAHSFIHQELVIMRPVKNEPPMLAAPVQQAEKYSIHQEQQQAASQSCSSSQQNGTLSFNSKSVASYAEDDDDNFIIHSTGNHSI